MHTAEPQVLGRSYLEFEITLAKFKKCKSEGSNEISAELIRAGGEILTYVVHEHISSICWELPSSCTTCGFSSSSQLHKIVKAVKLDVVSR
jgi:hypothetical protein